MSTCGDDTVVASRGRRTAGCDFGKTARISDVVRKWADQGRIRGAWWSGLPATREKLRKSMRAGAGRLRRRRPIMRHTWKSALGCEARRVARHENLADARASGIQAFATGRREAWSAARYRHDRRHSAHCARRTATRHATCGTRLSLSRWRVLMILLILVLLRRCSGARHTAHGTGQGARRSSGQWPATWHGTAATIGWARCGTQRKGGLAGDAKAFVGGAAVGAAEARTRARAGAKLGWRATAVEGTGQAGMSICG